LHELQCKPFEIRTLFAFGHKESLIYDHEAKIGVSPDGVICTSTHDHIAPPTLHVISPAGVRQCSFSAIDIKATLGLACSSEAIFVAGSLDIRGISSVVQKYDYEGTLLCSMSHADAGYLWLIENGIYTARLGYPYRGLCRFAVLSTTDLQQIGT